MQDAGWPAPPDAYHMHSACLQLRQCPCLMMPDMMNVCAHIYIFFCIWSWAAVHT